MKRLLPLSACLVLALGHAAAQDANSLRKSLTLLASFDKRVDADIATGDPRIYSSPTSNRANGAPGLPADNLVVRAPGEGRFGDALRFTRKMKPVVFFKGPANIGYQTKSWSGSCSVWLKLDPDKDLEPGYCDPLQYVAQEWNEGNMFIEFSKDHTPRHFRYAIRSVLKHWNPENIGWEQIPEKERPMVAVHQPPFRSDEWTHVVFTFTNINSGQKNAVGKLYLNGQLQGSFEREHVFNWDPSQIALTMGLAYVGLMDDLAVFDRALEENEVKAVYESNKPMAELVSAGSEQAKR